MAIITGATLAALSLASLTRPSPALAKTWIYNNGEWLSKLIEDHKTWLQKANIAKFQEVYDGYLEEIDSRDRSRGDNINHKIMASYAQLVIDTPTDYLVGRPPTITVEDPEQADSETKEAEIITEYRKAVKELLKPEKSQRVFSEWLRQGCIAGYSAVICWIDEDGEIQYAEFPAQEVIPVYDTRGRLVLVVRYYTIQDLGLSGDPEDYTRVEVYDDRYVTYYKGSEGSTTFELDEDEIGPDGNGNPYEHKAGMLPVSIFVNGTAARYSKRVERSGVSDLDNGVLSLILDYANTMSDKANTVEATLDQYLLLQGCDTDEDEVIKMHKARALVLKGDKNESAASFIAPTQQDQAVENYLNRVKDTIYDLAFIPRLNDLSGATATEIKIKYSNLDMKASKKESYFIQAIDRFLQIVTNLLTTVNNKPYNAEWIKLTLNRNLPQNNKETADIVAELVDKVPDQYLFELLWFIKDPRKALEEMRAQKKEAAKTSIAAMGFDGEFVDTTTNDEGQTTNTNKDEKSTKNE